MKTNFLAVAIMVASFSITLPNVAFAHSNVEHTMKQMQRAYKGALQSNSLAEIQPYIVKLHQYSDEASKASYGKTEAQRADYKDGMRELQTDLQDVDDALAQKNLSLAKKLLQEQVKKTKTDAHKALKVDEEDEEHENEGNEQKHRWR